MFARSMIFFYHQWKQPLIHPIPEKSNPTGGTDLRPINILPAISELIEKKYESANNILPSFQSGFRKGHSWMTY